MWGGHMTGWGERLSYEWGVNSICLLILFAWFLIALYFKNERFWNSKKKTWIKMEGVTFHKLATCVLLILGQ